MHIQVTTVIDNMTSSLQFARWLAPPVCMGCGLRCVYCEQRRECSDPSTRRLTYAAESAARLLGQPLPCARLWAPLCVRRTAPGGMFNGPNLHSEEIRRLNNFLSRLFFPLHYVIAHFLLRSLTRAGTPGLVAFSFPNPIR